MSERRAIDTGAAPAAPHAAGHATARSVDVAVGRPFPWPVLLEYLGARLIPGRERIDGGRYVRLGADRRPEVAIGHDAEQAALRLTVARGDADAAAVNAARLFGAEQDGRACAALRDDPLLAARIAAAPGLRPLGCWEPFELCVRTLLGQQVSVQAAQTLAARVTARCGAIDPASVADADLSRIGMPGRRADAIQGFARAVRSGRVDLDSPWPALDAALAALPGFGPWTRSYLGIRLGRDPDAFPCADAGLIRAAGARDAKDLERIAERWRPRRALAAAYLWMVPPPARDPS